MIVCSKKAGKLFFSILTRAGEEWGEVGLEDLFDSVGKEAKLEAFESTQRIESFFHELPKKVSNLTYFFDPNDGMYGFYSLLGEDKLIAALTRIGKKRGFL